MRRKSDSDPISLFAFQDIITAVTGIILLLVILLALSLVQLPETEPDRSGQLAAKKELMDQIHDLQAELDQITLSPHLDESLKLLPAAEIKKKLDHLEQTAKTMATEKADLEKALSSRQKMLEETVQEIANNPIFAETQRLKQKREAITSEISALQLSNKRLYNFNQSKKSPWVIDMKKGKIKVAKSHRGPSEKIFDSVSESQRIRNLKSWISQNGNSNSYFVVIARQGTVAEFRAIKQHIDSLGADMGIDLVSPTTTVLD